MENFSPKTLKHVLERSAAAFSNLPALTFVDDVPFTYAELKKEVDTLSHLLRGQGVGAGDRVAILSENMPNWGIAYFAVTTMGAVACPILPEFHPSEIHHIIRQSGCRAAFISEKLFDKMKDCDCRECRTLILINHFQVVGPDTDMDRLNEILQSGKKAWSRLKESALHIAKKTPKEKEVEEGDVASIIYTSGTTGHSKGVMLTHKNIVANALATLETVDVDETDRFISLLPLSHAYECTLGLVIPVLRGASVHYLLKPPTPSVLLPALSSVRPTMILAVPLIIEKIVKQKIFPQFTGKALVRDLYRLPLVRKKLHQAAGKKLKATFGGRLRFFGIGGAPVSPEVEAFLREADFPYAVGYGLTETAPLISGCAPAVTRYRSAGKPLSNAEVRIESPDPKTGEGEIWTRGECVMKGYYNDPERTAEVLTRDGWFKTGDLGMLDGDGYLFIRGRLKNMILGASGENIYPEEIENALNAFDWVLESLVYQEEGQIVARVHLNYDLLDAEAQKHKWTETRTQEHVTRLLEDIRLAVNEKTSSFSRINRMIEQTEPFEKTPTQKIKRYLYSSSKELA
jgi:long-chain acyl-CoA synthetase